MTNNYSVRPIFGIPTYRGMIDPTQYEKQKLIDDITHNYSIDPKRNIWDNEHELASDIHHSYRDLDNPNFNILDFTSVLPQYLNHIHTFINTLNFWRPFKFNFHIVNYTCMGKGQHMREHIHNSCDFVAIHYLKLNKNHPQTTFVNPAHWRNYMNVVFTETLRTSVNDFLEDSWLKEYYSFYAVEDEFIITPSTLGHTVAVNKSDELRMTIALNITLSEIDTLEKFPDKYK